MVASPMEKDALRATRGKRRPPPALLEAMPAVIPARHARRASTARRWSAAILVAGFSALLVACSSPMDNHPDIKLNPHPVHRYELIATVDAPGQFDSVEGYLSYDVTNVECVPKDTWEGARNVPGTSRTFKLTRVDAHTWKGSFYRDLLEDEDYFGLGVCHWDATNAFPVFKIHGENFSPGFVLGEPFETSLTRYFRKSDYFNNSLSGAAALEYRDVDEEVTRTPGSFFPITVTVRRLDP